MQGVECGVKGDGCRIGVVLLLLSFLERVQFMVRSRFQGSWSRFTGLRDVRMGSVHELLN